MSWTVAALYKFTPVEPKGMSGILRDACMASGVCGTLILANEGINGTVAAPTLEHMDVFLNVLRAQPGLSDILVKFSASPDQPFKRLKIKIKPEIVTLRRPEANPTKIVGTYVEPQNWNALIAGDDVLVLDARNTYETEVGVFENALDPKLENFCKFPDFVSKHLDPLKHKKIAMYCTGGIRCEKASSYLLAHGFENVFHLKGGILKYLEDVPAKESKWQGECFVFDERRSVDEKLGQ